ncbi:MAG: uracil-DNA glycosylase [Planctomycetota bacterium]|nr:uracil-DNA glycosylase [Planctomycetota bacterium]
MRGIRSLIEQLAAAKSGPDLANPWADEDPALDVPRAATLRRANLEAYLTLLAARPPRLLVVGEAPSYRGCRFTGIIFTSEHTLATHPFFSQARFVRTSRRPVPWREASATIVWETIDRLERPPALWAAVPFHTRKAGEPLSNRTPTRLEMEDALPLLEQIRRLFPKAAVVAAGRIAERSLAALGVPCVYVRHPSHGGKAAFQAGVLAAGKRAQR